jgi:mRNA interferase RelE/StbE
MSYRVEISPAAQRNLKKLQREIVELLSPIIMSLADNPLPTGVRKISGEKYAYRLKVRSYRIIYDFYDEKNLVLILKVDRRNESTYKF